MISNMKMLSVILALALLLSACGNTAEKPGSASNNPEQNGQNSQSQEQAEGTTPEESEEAGEDVAYAEVFKSALDELAKAQDGKEVNYQQVIDLYTKNLQPLVQQRDEEFSETVDQQLMSALEAGKNGELDGAVVKQIFDKLMQKVFFLTIRHEFNEAKEHWADKEKVKEELEEAKEFYAILKTTVEKRDTAYSTTMADVIDSGFAEMEKAVESGDELAFQLGKQVVDKTLMKTFYLAAGATPHGYAFKVKEEAAKDAEKAKVEQAEGWAFYQSLYPYLSKPAKEEADFIQGQFDLSTDVKSLDPQAVNKAFVRGFAKVALHEYEESEKNWGQDKSVITALEGALFIDMIGMDLKQILGEEGYATLNEQAHGYLEAVKAQNKEEAASILEKIRATLNSVIEKAK